MDRYLLPITVDEFNLIKFAIEKSRMKSEFAAIHCETRQKIAAESPEKQCEGFSEKIWREAGQSERRSVNRHGKFQDFIENIDFASLEKA